MSFNRFCSLSFSAKILNAKFWQGRLFLKLSSASPMDRRTLMRSSSWPGPLVRWDTCFTSIIILPQYYNYMQILIDWIFILFMILWAPYTRGAYTPLHTTSTARDTQYYATSPEPVSFFDIYNSHNVHMYTQNKVSTRYTLASCVNHFLLCRYFYNTNSNMIKYSIDFVCSNSLHILKIFFCI